VGHVRHAKISCDISVANDAAAGGYRIWGSRGGTIAFTAVLRSPYEHDGCFNRRLEPAHQTITLDGATNDAMQCAIREALIPFMAATAQAQAEATKEAQRAGIAHAKASGGARAYKGRKPSYSRKQFESAQAMLGKSASVGEVAKSTGLTRQTVYRVKDDPAVAEAALATWSM
jgi:Helix-turn-helix domain of resolvase